MLGSGFASGLEKLWLLQSAVLTVSSAVVSQTVLRRHTKKENTSAPIAVPWWEQTIALSMIGIVAIAKFNNKIALCILF